MNAVMSDYTRTFRRTLRKAHLTLVYSDERSEEENLAAITAAIQRVRKALPASLPLVPIGIAETLVVLTPPQIEHSSIVGVDRRYRDPALVEQEINGCKSLLLEIIRRAAYDWVLYRTSTRILHKKLAEQAYHWLFVEDESDPTWQERKESGKQITSFLAICSALDITPESVRHHVRKLTPKNVMSVGRPAEYRRRDAGAVTEGEDTYSYGNAKLPEPKDSDDFNES